jgi:hypothetical protein
VISDNKIGTWTGVFEVGALRRILGANDGGWRKLHNQELHSIIRVTK